MRNILTIAKYELKRLFRDWRLILMVLSQPIVISLIVGLLASHDPEGVKISVRNQVESTNASLFIEKLKSYNDLIVTVDSEATEHDIVARKARAVLEIRITDLDNDTGDISLITDPSGGIASIFAEKKVSEAASYLGEDIVAKKIALAEQENIDKIKKNLPAEIASSIPSIKINKEEIDPLNFVSKSAGSSDLRYFDYYGSSMMVMLVVMVLLNLSGISITSERISGTFERMSVTPYSKSDIILGKAIALFLIGLIVSTLGIMSSYVFYNLVLGNILLLGLITVLVVGMAVSLGLLISSLTSTVVESVELAMYAFFISFLASGILFALESSHSIFNIFVKALPFFYAVDASRRINMLGANWNDISSDVYIVAAYMILFIILATVTLKRKA